MEMTQNIEHTEGDTEEVAPTDVESPPQPEKKRFLGVGLALMGAVLYSISSIIIKILEYQPFNLGVWRFGVMNITLIPFLIGAVVKDRDTVFKGLWPLNPNGTFLLIQAIVGANSIILVFFGIKYLDLADVTVIGTSAPVFVTFTAYLMLGERCGVVPILTALLTLVGVGIVSKPTFLIGAKSLSSGTLIGIGTTFVSMTLLTFHYVLLRKIRIVHHSLVNLSFAFWGLVECIIVTNVMGEFAYPKNYFEISLLLATSFLALAAQTCLIFAMKYEQAGPVALVRTSEVVFAFIWQALFLGVQADWFSIIGAVIVLSGVLITSLRKIIISLPEENKFRKRFGFLLV